MKLTKAEFIDLLADFLGGACSSHTAHVQGNVLHIGNWTSYCIGCLMTSDVHTLSAFVDDLCELAGVEKVVVHVVKEATHLAESADVSSLRDLPGRCAIAPALPKLEWIIA